MTLPYRHRMAVERAVVDFVEDYGVEYPVDVFALAQQMGISVTFYEDMPISSKNLSEHISSDAFTVTNSANATFHVFMKGNPHPRSRAVFTLGHELGHIWLEHRKGDGFEESEADYFSGYLLVPHPLVISGKMSVHDIVQAFGVGGWSAEIAYRQAEERKSFGLQHWEEHELRLLELVSPEVSKAAKPP